jgi:hypothetical protein
LILRGQVLSRYKDAIYWMANHGGFDTSRSLERRLADLAASQVVRMTSDLYVRPVTVVVQDVLRQQDQQAGKSTHGLRADRDCLEAHCHQRGCWRSLIRNRCVHMDASGPLQKRSVLCNTFTMFRPLVELRRAILSRHITSQAGPQVSIPWSPRAPQNATRDVALKKVNFQSHRFAVIIARPPV